MVVYGLCRPGIGADDAECRGVGRESVVVEDVQLRGDVVVGIFSTYEVAGQEP